MEKENLATPVTDSQTMEMLFKGINSGTSKKSGKPFSICQLHDPASLENLDFFLTGEEEIPHDLQFKERVKVSFGMGIMFGRIQSVLKKVERIPSSHFAQAK